MRLIGTFDNAKHADRFIAYLLTEGINSHLEEEGSDWEIWIKDEDQLSHAKQLLDDYRDNPDDGKYREAVAKAESIQREKERKRREYQKRVQVTVNPSPQTQKTPLTLLFIGICALVAVLTNFGRQYNTPVFRALTYTSIEPEKARDLIKKYDGNPFDPSFEVLTQNEIRHSSVISGQFWRFITPIFIHFGSLHIVFNMIWFFQLGRVIEQRYSTFYLGMLILVTAGISNLAQCAVPVEYGGSTPMMLPGGRVLMLLGGMSGVVYGLFGFIWVKASIDPTSRLFMPASTVLIMIVWLFFCMSPMAENFGMGNVANWAHAVGLIVGMAAAYILTAMRK